MNDTYVKWLPIEESRPYSRRANRATHDQQVRAAQRGGQSLASSDARTGPSLTQGFFFAEADFWTHHEVRSAVAINAVGPARHGTSQHFVRPRIFGGDFRLRDAAPTRGAATPQKRRFILRHPIGPLPGGGSQTLEGCGADRSARYAHLSAKFEKLFVGPTGIRERRNSRTKT